MSEFNILDPMGLFTGAQLAGVPAETLGEFPEELADPTEEVLSRPDVLTDILGDDDILDALEADEPDVLDNILDMIEEDEEGTLGDEADNDEAEYLEEMLGILEDEAPDELDGLVLEFPDVFSGVNDAGGTLDEDTLRRRRRGRARRAVSRIRSRARRVRRRVSRSVRRRVSRARKTSRRAIARARAATRRRITRARSIPRRVGRYVRTKARKAKVSTRARIARYVAKRAGIPTPPAVPGMPAIPAPPGMPVIPGMPAMPTPPAGMPAMPTPPEMPVVKFPFPLPPGMEMRDLPKVPTPPGAPAAPVVQVPVMAGTPVLPELPAPPAMPGAPALGDDDKGEDEYLEETLDLPEVSETPANEERIARGMLAGEELSHEGIPVETLITERPVVTEAAELLAEPPEEELLGMGLI